MRRDRRPVGGSYGVAHVLGPPLQRGQRGGSRVAAPRKPTHGRDPGGAECGFVALAESELALNRGAADEADAYATRAVDVGERRQSEPDCLWAHSSRSRTHRSGQTRGGSAALDEAMALVLSGRLDVFFTGAVYCTVIAECRDVADMQRL